MSRNARITAVPFLLPLLVAASVAHSAAAEPVAFDLPRLAQPPAIDGHVEDPAWSTAHQTGDFVRTDGTAASVSTRAMIAQDAGGLWIAIRCQEPQPQAIRTAVTRRNGRVWLDDGIELFLDADRDQRSYVHLVMNVAGARFAQRSSVPPDASADGPWEPVVYWASHVGADHWSAELYLPFASIPGAASGSWGINLCRNRMTGAEAEYTVSLPTLGSFHQPASFAEMRGVAVPPLSTVDWSALSASITAKGARLEGLPPEVTGVGLAKVLLEGDGGQIVSEKNVSLGQAALVVGEPSELKGVSAIRVVLADEQQTVVAASPRVPLIAAQAIQLQLRQPYFDLEETAELAWKIDDKVLGGLATPQPTIRVVSEDGSVVHEASVSSSKPAGTNEVPIRPLKPGKYTVQLTMKSREGISVEQTVAFEKLPPPEKVHRVTFDEHGRVRVDEKVFLPVGLYRVAPPQWESVLGGSGFNIVHDMGVGAGRFRRVGENQIEWTTTLDEIQQQMDRAHRLGLKVLFELGVYVKEVFEVEPGEEHGRRLREVVSRFRRHPALLAYYLIDEPYTHHFERTKRAYELVQSIDPNHPMIAPSLGRSFYYKPTAENVDALLISCYPVPYRPITEVGRQLATARSLVPNKPIWFVPQAVSLRKNEFFPTVQQEQAMVYQSLAQGAKGLIFFAWAGDQPRQNGPLATANPEFWRGLVELTKEVGRYHEVLLAPDEHEGVTIEAPPGVDIRVRRQGGHDWILAVNTQPQTVRMTLATGTALIDPSRWIDVRRDQAAELEAGAIVDPLPPYGVRLWRGPGTTESQYKVSATLVGGFVPDPANRLINPSFEGSGKDWELSGNARVVAGDGSFDGSRHLRLTAGKEQAVALSPPIEVRPGQRLLCSFYAAVSEKASGSTVDAFALVFDAAGASIARLPLVGPDERVARDFPWDWMGKSIEMPAGAATLRLELGTSHNPGVTRYDGLRVVDEQQLTATRAK